MSRMAYSTIWRALQRASQQLLRSNPSLYPSRFPLLLDSLLEYTRKTAWKSLPRGRAGLRMMLKSKSSTVAPKDTEVSSAPGDIKVAKDESTAEDAALEIRLLESAEREEEAPTQQPLSKIGAHQLFPSIESVFPIPSFPRAESMLGGLIGRIKAFFGRSRTRSPPKSRVLGKHVVVIAIHGWFPTKLLQRVLGIPRGTSSRLASNAAAAIRTFSPDSKVTMMPVEGEGKLGDRTTTHYEQLCNTAGWLEQLKTADTVMLAAHSQGCPVSIMLVARLIEDGILNPSIQNVGILAMAAVFSGPFPPLKANLVVKYIEAEAARELFELCDGNSKVSTELRHAFDTVLGRGVKLTCVSSWMDQVVPLYSSTLYNIRHPNVWRAVYVDAHNYCPDFLTDLVSLTIKIHNLGIEAMDGSMEDQDLLVHLSEYVSGGLYHSNAHSTIYDDANVYKMAIDWMLHAKQEPSPQPVEHRYVGRAPVPNSYHLPWIMRGLFDSSQLKRNSVTKDDLEHLKEAFLNWRPERKSLLELKYRLDPLRARA